MLGSQGTCTHTDGIWLTVFGMFFILLFTLVYTGGEHKLSQMMKHSKYVFYLFLGNIGYFFFLTFVFKQTTTMDKQDQQQVSSIYTSDKVLLRCLVETGPVEFSNLVLVLLPLLGTQVGEVSSTTPSPCMRKEG